MSVSNRVTALDPLRGIASFAVMWFHLAHGSSYLADGHWLDNSGTYGFLGVQVFFVISGFVLPHALLIGAYKIRYFPNFVAKRVIRLDPPYIVTILGVIAITYISTFVPGWGGKFELTWIQLLGHLGYINALLGLPWIVSVFWTLAVEFQFYLLLALIFPLLVHRSVGIKLVCLGCLCLVALFFPHSGSTSFRPYVFQHIYLFALGIIAFWLYHRIIDKRLFLILLFSTAVGVASTLGVLEMLAGVCTALFIVLLPNFKGNRLLTYLGTISYSLYLVHLPIGDRFLGLVERMPGIPKPIGLLAAVSASLVAAHILYRLVEKPSRQLSSSIRYRKLAVLT